MCFLLRGVVGFHTHKFTTISSDKLIPGIFCQVMLLTFNKRDGQRRASPTPYGYEMISLSTPKSQTIRGCLLQSFHERGPPTVPPGSRTKSGHTTFVHW
jgi:hypothetical protein